jgi:hypothetical protein
MRPNVYNKPQILSKMLHPQRRKHHIGLHGKNSVVITLPRAKAAAASDRDQ